MGTARPVGIGAVNVDAVVNGRQWKVALEPAERAGTFTVTIKGKSRLVDASWIDANTLSLIDGAVSREVRLHVRQDDGAVGVEFGGKLYEVLISHGDPRLTPRGIKAAIPQVAAHGIDHPITAPMPGRVMRVLVGVGDAVVARQGVVVIEAMKMENELRTSRDGVVKEVRVVPGAAVETGAVLVVVE